jgi:hypothetical protein
MKTSTSETFWHGQTGTIKGSWLIKGLLPEMGTALLSGQWGMYKSFALLELGASLITGKSFAGHRVKRRGGVLVFAAEGAFDISNRLEGLAHAGRLPANPQPFSWKATFPSLLQAGSYSELEQMAAEIEKEMLVKWGVPLVAIAVDTMAAAAGFRDEQDNAEGQRAMNVLGQLAKRFKCCTIAVDHFGKDVTAGTRGGSAKEAAADAVLAILDDRKLSGEVSNCRLAIRKLRNGQAGKEIRFDTRVLQLGSDEDGDPITTRVIEWKTSGERQPMEAKKPRWTTTLEPLRKALTTVLSEQGQLTRPFGQEGLVVRAVNYDILRAEFFTRVTVDSPEERQADAKRKKFDRAFDAAARLGLIEVYQEMVWLILAEDESPPVNLQKDRSEYRTGTASDPAPRAGAYPN